MARGLIKIQEELHHRLLKLRSIDALIHRPEFEALWNDSTVPEQAELVEFITQANREALYKWVREHPSLDVTQKSLPRLRAQARRLGLENFSRLGKIELIRNILEKEKHNAK